MALHSDEPTAARPTLVMGIGNILLRDEGAGVRVIEAMRSLALPDGVELADAGTSGADLVELIAGRPKVIVVDAVDAGGAPGSVFRFGPDDLLPDEGDCVSLHQLGLLQSLVMARQLGCAPQDVVIFGVQPGVIGAGLELTAEVAAAVHKVVEAVLAELSQPDVASSK